MRNLRITGFWSEVQTKGPPLYAAVLNTVQNVRFLGWTRSGLKNMPSSIHQLKIQSFFKNITLFLWLKNLFQICVGFEVLTVVGTKMVVFWVVAPCSLVRPDDGGSKDIRNVGKLLPDHTALQPRRQPSYILKLVLIQLYWLNKRWRPSV
jgi:hypothetical protein